MTRLGFLLLALLCHQANATGFSPPFDCGLSCGVLRVPCQASFSYQSPDFPLDTPLPPNVGSCQCSWLVMTEAPCTLVLTMDSAFNVYQGLMVAQRANGTNANIGGCFGTSSQSCNGISSKGQTLYITIFDVYHSYHFKWTVLALPKSSQEEQESGPPSAADVGRNAAADVRSLDVTDCRCSQTPLSLAPGQTTLYSTPAYPSDYPAYCNCFTPLVAPPGHRINVTATSVDLQDGYDFLLLRSCESEDTRDFYANGTTWRLAGWITGSAQKSVVLESNCGSITFVSDLSNSGKGASLELTLLPTACVDEPCGSGNASCSLFHDSFLCTCPPSLGPQPGLGQACSATSASPWPLVAALLIALDALLILGLVLCCLLRRRLLRCIGFTCYKTPESRVVDSRRAPEGEDSPTEDGRANSYLQPTGPVRRPPPPPGSAQSPASGQSNYAAPMASTAPASTTASASHYAAPVAVDHDDVPPSSAYTSTYAAGATVLPSEHYDYPSMEVGDSAHSTSGLRR